MLCFQDCIVATQPQAFLAPHPPTVDCKKLLALVYHVWDENRYKSTLRIRQYWQVAGCILRKAEGSSVQWSGDSCGKTSISKWQAMHCHGR